jgi:hypothetical protein
LYNKNPVACYARSEWPDTTTFFVVATDDQIKPGFCYNIGMYGGNKLGVTSYSVAQRPACNVQNIVWERFDDSALVNLKQEGGLMMDVFKNLLLDRTPFS